VGELVVPVAPKRFGIDARQNCVNCRFCELFERELLAHDLTRSSRNDVVAEVTTDMDQVVDVARAALPLVQCAGLLREDLPSSTQPSGRVERVVVTMEDRALVGLVDEQLLLRDVELHALHPLAGEAQRPNATEPRVEGLAAPLVSVLLDRQSVVRELDACLGRDPFANLVQRRLDQLARQRFGCGNGEVERQRVMTRPRLGPFGSSWLMPWLMRA
jgi:hypothetical protein